MSTHPRAHPEEEDQVLSWRYKSFPPESGAQIEKKPERAEVERNEEYLGKGEGDADRLVGVLLRELVPPEFATVATTAPAAATAAAPGVGQSSRGPPFYPRGAAVDPLTMHQNAVPLSLAPATALVQSQPFQGRPVVSAHFALPIGYPVPMGHQAFYERPPLQAPELLAGVPAHYLTAAGSHPAAHDPYSFPHLPMFTNLSTRPQYGSYSFAQPLHRNALVVARPPIARRPMVRSPAAAEAEAAAAAAAQSRSELRCPPVVWKEIRLMHPWLRTGTVSVDEFIDHLGRVAPEVKVRRGDAVHDLKFWGYRVDCLLSTGTSEENPFAPKWFPRGAAPIVHDKVLSVVRETPRVPAERVLEIFPDLREKYGLCRPTDVAHVLQHFYPDDFAVEYRINWPF